MITRQWPCRLEEAKEKKINVTEIYHLYFDTEQAVLSPFVSQKEKQTFNINDKIFGK